MNRPVEEYPCRKRNRLTHIRYSENGAYFITICTKDRRNLFWTAEAAGQSDNGTRNPTVGAALRRPPGIPNRNGDIVMREIHKFDEIYDGIVTVDNYVVMPNRVHLLLSIHTENTGGRRNAAPTISSVINQFKGCVSKGIGFSCWQKSFHDHVVRDEREYRKIWEYIDANPGKWTEDCYFIEIDD